MQNLEKAHDDQETMRLVVRFLKAGSVDDHVGYKRAIDAEFPETNSSQRVLVDAEEATKQFTEKYRRAIGAHMVLQELNGIVPSKVLRSVRGKLHQMHIKKHQHLG